MQELDGKSITLNTGTHHIASGEVGSYTSLHGPDVPDVICYFNRELKL